MSGHPLIKLGSGPEAGAVAWWLQSPGSVLVKGAQAIHWHHITDVKSRTAQLLEHRSGAAWEVNGMQLFMKEAISIHNKSFKYMNCSFY